MESLKKQYIRTLTDHISVSIEDLSNIELSIINKSYELFEWKLKDIKILNDEIKRLSIELANLKSMLDDKEYNYDEE